MQKKRQPLFHTINQPEELFSGLILFYAFVCLRCVIISDVVVVA